MNSAERRKMNLTRPTESSRREFLTGSARYLLLGVLTACGVLAKVRRRPPVGGKCINAGLCQGCSIFARCELPIALFARRKLTGG